MKKYKKYVIIFVILIVLFFIISSVSFKLKGSKDIIIEYGTEYQDEGFIAKTLFGRDISNNVVMENDVDTNNIGKYKVVYRLQYLWIKKEIVRNVSVAVNSIDSFDIILNGKNIVYQSLGEKYKELGGYVQNAATNEKIYNKLKIEGKVNINQLGENEIKYIYEYNNEKKEEIRKVIVFNFQNDANDIITNEGKEIHIKIEGIDDYRGTVTPNETIIKDNEFTYYIEENGEYKFKIYTKENNEIEYKLTIDSIIKDYECKGTITRYGTNLEVVSGKLNDVEKFKWKIDGQEIDGKNEYNNPNSIKKGQVEIVFNNKKTLELSCAIEDKLIYHFKYDENNTKPFMKCNTYQAAERMELDTKLRQVVNEAGYGTRAGVVEAARFLVGALDYKVPYVGASRYNEKGLNIGQSNAWGCSGVGLDCFYFVYWALSQNGLPLGALYSGDKPKTRDVLNQIKVGDYILTPCEEDECKNRYRIDHIGLIIGIDDNYIYVAEATTGRTNAVVVSKWEKNNMPDKGKFSVVKLVKYPSEGNVTNMWVE